MTYARTSSDRGSLAIASRNTSWPFHTAKVESRPTRTTSRPQAGRPESPSRSSRVPLGEKRVQVDGVPDRLHWRQCAAQRQKIVPDAPRVGDRQGASRSAAFEHRCAQSPPRHVVVQVPDERCARRLGPRREHVHLQAVAVDEVRCEFTHGAAQLRDVLPDWPDGLQAAQANRGPRSPAAAVASFAEPGQRRRERQQPYVSSEPPRPLQQWTVGAGNQSDRPRWAGVAQAGNHLEQRVLGAAHLGRGVEEEHPHKRRCRTTIVSSACTMSSGLTSISFLLRMMRRRRVLPRSVAPPAIEIACRTVRFGSST